LSDQEYKRVAGKEVDSEELYTEKIFSVLPYYFQKRFSKLYFSGFFSINIILNFKANLSVLISLMQNSEIGRV